MFKKKESGQKQKKGKRKKRQGAVVALTLVFCFGVLTWGVVTAYDNTRTLGFGDSSGMVSVFESNNGRRFVQIGQQQVDVQAFGADIVQKFQEFLGALEQFVEQLF